MLTDHRAVAAKMPRDYIRERALFAKDRVHLPVELGAERLERPFDKVDALRGLRRGDRQHAYAQGLPQPLHALVGVVQAPKVRDDVGVGHLEVPDHQAIAGHVHPARIPCRGRGTAPACRAITV